MSDGCIHAELPYRPAQSQAADPENSESIAVQGKRPLDVVEAPPNLMAIRDEEDVFDFGGGLDRLSSSHAATSSATASSCIARVDSGACATSQSSKRSWSAMMKPGYSEIDLDSD